MTDTPQQPAAGRPRLSVVVPVLNEERNVDALFDRLFRVLHSIEEPFEVICVDDGSTDATPRMLEAEARKRPELRVVTLARNFGQHAAIIAGFNASRGDWVVTIDADLQNPPEEIPRIVEEFRKGHDLVGTYREDRQDTSFRKGSSWFVNRVVRKCSGIDLKDFGCMLRGYSGDVARAIAERGEYKTFIPALGTLYAGDPVEIPVSHAPRAAGKSKYSFTRLVGLTLDLVTSFSLAPLRLLFVCGSVISALGIGFGLTLLALRLVFGTEWAAQGVFTLFAILFIFVGAQFIAFGLLGEYIGRVFQQVRERPPYVLKMTRTRTVLDEEPPAPVRPGEVTRKAADWIVRARKAAAAGSPAEDTAGDQADPQPARLRSNDQPPAGPGTS